MQGFIEDGAVDEKTQTWPDFDKILAGCRRKVTLEEVSSIKTNFPLLYDTFSRLGKIPEEVFDELNFAQDTDTKGNVKPRNTNSIVHSRAMCYSTKSIQEARSKHVQQEREVQRMKQLDKVNKVNDILQLNKSCEAKLPNGITTATLADFGRTPGGPLAPELEAFVHCRLFTTPSRPRNAQWEGEKFKATNKGKIQEAELGEDNNISRSFKVKNRPIIMEEPSLEEVALPVIAQAVVGPTVLPTLAVGSIDVVRSSVKSLVKSKEWNEAVRGEIVGAVFSDQMRDGTITQAEQLLSHLDERIKTLLASRLPQQKYRDNFCFRWAKINFPRVAVMSCWGGHATDDLTAIRTTDSLFSNNFSHFVVLDPESYVEGCYLFRDNRRGCFVRSGKASPTLCIDRVKAHREAAKESTKGFYGKYPSKFSINITGTRIGFFHQLTACIGLGFIRASTNCLVDTSDKGIFEWDDVTLTAISKWNVPGTKEDKQRMLVAFLFEFVYDLMLSPSDCVSLNPGFESCHGYYGQHN